MILSKIDSEFLRYLLASGHTAGERLPSLAEISAETDMSMGKLREQFEVARMLGLVEASPRRGISRTEYSFLPAVRLSLLTALAIDPSHFDAFSGLRAHLESVYWEEAVALLAEEDFATLRALVAAAWQKLSEPRIQIPYQEHRELHLTIYRRLDNPFVVGLLEAYWDAYEAVELNTYADYGYLQEVWRYHEHIVEAICQGRPAEGKQLLIEHMQLLSARGASIEMPVHTNGVAAPANLSM
ncbi:MAG: FCD domain-containing protein [Caldilinea sp.]|uniref:FadR/GntR family transcriptional regulator n=1 Tax=Caldilinea sp. TaxID=2293560 RepID=UPI002C5A2E0E|nr:FadR family transcriptional regulator [Anaerolineales bacterium]HQY93286.1 FCD domain-containing protein [Caldilinea sp.]